MAIERSKVTTVKSSAAAHTIVKKSKAQGHHAFLRGPTKDYEGNDYWTVTVQPKRTKSESSVVREFIEACKHEDGPVVRKGSKRRNSLKRFHYKKKNEKAVTPVKENFNPARFKTEAVLPSAGEGYGFMGTIDSGLTDITWEKAFKFFTDYVKPIEATFGDKILPKDIRDFLDSKYGRKIADFLNSGQTLPQALNSYSRSFMTSVMMPFLGYRPKQILYFKNPKMTTESRKKVNEGFVGVHDASTEIATYMEEAQDKIVISRSGPTGQSFKATIASIGAKGEGRSIPAALIALANDLGD